MSELLSKPLTVAVLGSGGREHALAEKLSQSEYCKKLYVLPGNAGVELRARGKITCILEDFKDLKALPEKLKKLEVDLVVIGPDDLLFQGVTGILEKAGFLVFGPSKEASKLEWSKAFAKEVLASTQVPTAGSAMLHTSDTHELARLASTLGGFPLVLKYDGLALGKGVRVCESLEEGASFLKEVFEDRKFERIKGEEAAVLVEQFLKGHEVSLFAVTDGHEYVLLEPICDHKRLRDGNQGPNTGGMGAYSPVPWLPRVMAEEFAESIFPKVLKHMRDRQTPFKGVLYAGLMVKAPNFWVLEFNARFGDPETQALLPRLKSDLLPILYGAARGELKRHSINFPVRWTSEICVNIVAASPGYPETPETGFEIAMPQDFSAPATVGDDKRVFFSGVKMQDEKLCTSGGRVFSVSALGKTLDESRRKSLDLLEKVRFEGMVFRKDIGKIMTD